MTHLRHSFVKTVLAGAMLYIPTSVTGQDTIVTPAAVVPSPDTDVRVGGAARDAGSSMDDELADLTAIVAAERERIAVLRAEIERRSTALAEISARLEALGNASGISRPVAPETDTQAPAPPAASVELPRFDFYADSLVRLATLHQGYDGCIGCPDRTVGRLRLRFGAEGHLAPGLRAVFGLSVGELNDPNTVYQTLGGNLGRKVATWDRSYLSFRPARASWMELTAGKFPYTWLRSSMTFDVDFYPEGLSERFSFDLKRSGPLRNVSVQGVQIVVNERPNGPDTMVVGGQGSATFLLGGRVTTRAVFTQMDVRRPEYVLRAQLDGSDVGVRNTNAIVFDGAQALYASGFRYANVIVENAVKTRWPSLPVTITLEYQRNLRAATTRNAGTSLRFDAGRQQRSGDWGFGWHVFHVEQDAIVSALGESDWRAPSNVLQHRFALNVMLHQHVQGLFTWYRGRTLDSNLPNAVVIPGVTPGLREPWANRMYFDILYRY